MVVKEIKLPRRQKTNAIWAQKKNIKKREETPYYDYKKLFLFKKLNFLLGKVNGQLQTNVFYFGRKSLSQENMVRYIYFCTCF